MSMKILAGLSAAALLGSCVVVEENESSSQSTGGAASSVTGGTGASSPTAGTGAPVGGGRAGVTQVAGSPQTAAGTAGSLVIGEGGAGTDGMTQVAGSSQAGVPDQAAGAGQGSGAAGAGGLTVATAGAGTAGNAVGAGGMAGAAGAGASSDRCAGGETTPNNDQLSATDYVVGTSYQACLQDSDDVDFYQFSAPATSKGGYFKVSVTEVGDTGNIQVAAFSALDDGRFHLFNEIIRGQSGYFYFNAKQGASFRVSVAPYNIANLTPYLFKAVYTEVPDANEPNDLRSTATPITVGQPVEGYFFAGWEASTGIPKAEWNDWYQVDLTQGSATILLSLLAADVNGRLTLYNPVGTEIATQGDPRKGSSVTLTATIAEAGTYYVLAEPFTIPTVIDNVVQVPQYLSMPYTLTVTQ